MEKEKKKEPLYESGKRATALWAEKFLDLDLSIHLFDSI